MYAGVIVRRTPQSRIQISQADRPAPTSPHPITLTSLNRIDGVTSIGESKTSIWLGPSETGSGTWATVRGMGWGKGGEKGGFVIPPSSPSHAQSIQLSFNPHPTPVPPHHRHHLRGPFNRRETLSSPATLRTLTKSFGGQTCSPSAPTSVLPENRNSKT